MNRILIAGLVLATLTPLSAQEPVPVSDVKPAVAVTAADPATPAVAPTRVTSNSKVYIEPADNGIHSALAGALRKKKVPVHVVTNAAAADFIIRVTGEYRKAGWARTIMAGGYARGDANASMTVEHRASSTITYAYNVDKGGAWRGIQSAAEACAKHLKNHMDGKE